MSIVKVTSLASPLRFAEFNFRAIDKIGYYKLVKLVLDSKTNDELTYQVQKALVPEDYQYPLLLDELTKFKTFLYSHKGLTQLTCPYSLVNGYVIWEEKETSL
jgi:hypothetical protein